MSDPHFEELREQTADAVASDDLVSVYSGLIHKDGNHEYYFGNDTEDAEELREMAAIQLGMLLRVLADRSDSSVDEITNLAVERAEQMQLR
ncbi:hypothetical protein ACFQO4_00590 [Saliphagus sp. GCM10025334]